jgi:hypothetical protein
MPKMYFYKHGLLCEGCAQLLMLRLRAQGYGEPPVPNSFVWPEGWDWRPDAQVEKLFCSGCKRWIIGGWKKASSSSSVVHGEVKEYARIHLPGRYTL